MQSDNQVNTCPESPMLGIGGLAVISIWYESMLGFESSCLFRNPELWTSEMAESEKLVRSKGVAARVLAGETLVVPVRARVGDLASIYKFNGAGTLIWKLLEAPQTLNDLCSAVACHYDVGTTQVERDVAAFLDEMRSVGLVDVVPELAVTG